MNDASKSIPDGANRMGASDGRSKPTRDDLIRAVIEAAQAVDRENLDRVEVHVCDAKDDAVRRKGLFGPARALSESLLRLSR